MNCALQTTISNSIFAARESEWCLQKFCSRDISVGHIRVGTVYQRIDKHHLLPELQQPLTVDEPGCSVPTGAHTTGVTRVTLLHNVGRCPGSTRESANLNLTVVSFLYVVSMGSALRTLYHKLLYGLIISLKSRNLLCLDEGTS